MKLKYDKLLSNVGFNCNLRQYNKEWGQCFEGYMKRGKGYCAKVGQCRLTPGFRS